MRAFQSLRSGLAVALLAALPISCVPAGDAGEPADGASSMVPIRSTGDPLFAVDPNWPMDLPEDMILGPVTGVFVDSRDHVWVSHLPDLLSPEEVSAVQEPPLGTCCAPAPTVLEFDPDGSLVQAWGVPSQDVAEYPWNPHGIFVDHNDHVWVGSHVTHRVMKFTRDGEQLMTLGRFEENGGSNDPVLLGGTAGIHVDPTTNEVFLADGYRNRRVIVFNGDTGEYIRHWGAYGETPDDAYTYDFSNLDPGAPPRQFSNVHGLIGSRDGLLYIADRRGNRIQVFQHDGTFVMEKIIAPSTLASGSAFDFAFSPDTEQSLIFMADGTNHKVWILRRSDMEIVGEFGRGGLQVGQFLRPHGISSDSRGNIYVGEASTGRRVQKFSPLHP